MNDQPTLVQLAVVLIAGHARALYWFAIIKAVRALTCAGAVGMAEWLARVTGLRARVEAALRDLDESVH